MAIPALLGACASVPSHRYGVERLRFEGVETLDEQALRACIATEERKSVEIGFAALRNPECGKPPFDNARGAVRLWSWPWTSWPPYDEAILKLDIDRIERWYEARGYYEAHVTKVDFKPRGARDSEECEKAPCELDITVTVIEGRPVRLRHVFLRGVERLPEDLREDLEDALELEEGDIFDEAYYERARRALERELREEGYARAEVKGSVALHRGLLWADVTLDVLPGPKCRVGDVRVKSGSKVPTAPILAAAKFRRGQLYRESDLDDAQRSVYALGAFSAVNVRGDLEKPGELIDIIIDVEPRRESQVLIGAGIMSGMLTTGPAAEEWVSVPQWDVHLFGSYEHRNFFGGLRHFRVEERPRLLFLDSFPGVPEDSPRFGNSLYAFFSQPGIPEARTFLISDARWDVGPDPFLLFFRHDFGASVGLERGFFRQRLNIRVALHQDIMEVSPRQPIVADDEIPSSYRLSFLEERASLDLRDDALNPTKGAYLRVALHEAVNLWEPSWNYLRITPETRAYAPLGLGLVLAARFAIGALFIFDASSSLDAEAQKLGPQVYRLRGGGAQSNRGFAPGQLGDGIEGGIRRWESALELRVPLTNSLSIAAFTDMGDVHAGKGFRFDHLNTAVGGGLRYRTIIGPVRLDVGYRPDALQRARGGEPSDATTDLGFAKFKGAIHLTIGESF